MPAPAANVPVESAIQDTIRSQASGPLMAVRTSKANVTAPASRMERRAPQRDPGGQSDEQIDKPEGDDGSRQN